MCTDSEAAAAMEIGWPANVSCWEPSAPVIAKDAGEVPAGHGESMTQCTGVATGPPGNATVRVTPGAVPAPVSDTVTVYFLEEPATTEPESADLATWIEAQLTTMSIGP